MLYCDNIRETLTPFPKSVLGLIDINGYSRSTCVHILRGQDSVLHQMCKEPSADTVSVLVLVIIISPILSRNP